jgi:hypothetical protein
MTAPGSPVRVGSMATLVFGLLLTVIGAAQLIETYTHHPVWDYLWKFWPVLLIVMGTKIIIDHYRRVRS